jgi:hypothetical protein
LDAGAGDGVAELTGAAVGGVGVTEMQFPPWSRL